MENLNYQFKIFSDINPEEICRFNQEMYHSNQMPRIEDLQWQFRVGYKKGIEPLYILVDNKIVGQAGLLPIDLILDNLIETGIWFNSFIISKSMQGKGLGKLLTEKWMSLAPIHITNCNDNSMAIFRKYGWQEEFNTARFALPLNLYKTALSKQWKGWKLGATKLAQPLYFFWKKLNHQFHLDSSIRPVGTFTVEKLYALFSQSNEQGIHHDEHWFQWRFFEGPLRSQYHVIQLRDAAIIFRLFQLGNMKRLHVVFQNDIHDEKLHQQLLKSLIKYAIQQQVDLIWALTNKDNLKKLYQPILKHILYTRFAYHANELNWQTAIENRLIPLQAADSDYDTMYA